MSAYEPRYCAFVDIMGFRQLIERLSRDGDYLTLQRVLQAVHSAGPAIPTRAEADLRAQSISDAVAISTAVNADGLWELFDALESLALDLLGGGYFIRGAIVKGMLYHDNHMVFGQALVDAYKLESTIARYPRIVIPRDVFDDARSYSENDEWKHRICVSDDGPRYLHVLRRIAENVPEGFGALSKMPDQAEIRKFANMRDQIQNRLEEAVDNPRHYKKVNWFVTYWTRYCVPVKMVPELKGLEPINPPLGFAPETKYFVESGAI